MFRSKRKAADFAAEIEAHIELEAERLEAKGLRFELLAGGAPELEQRALALVEEHERALDETVAPRAISAVSRALLARIDLGEVARRRRAIARRMLGASGAFSVGVTEIPRRPRLNKPAHGHAVKELRELARRTPRAP